MKKPNEITMQFINACKVNNVEKCNISTSNKKLVGTPQEEIKNNYDISIGFAIFNLPCRATCPFATEACKKFCYAGKAETAYPDCKPSRIRNFHETRRDDFVVRMAYTIVSRYLNMKAKKLVVRIHESGDFYNRAYVKKWLEIIRLVESLGFTSEQIIFIAYTKSFPFFDGEKLPALLALRASLDATSPLKMIEIVRRNNWNVYRVVEKFSDNNNTNNCRCSDCATCGKCWNNAIYGIECEIH